jgi:phage/plasmid-like protein (TIGR03299 family)
VPYERAFDLIAAWEPQRVTPQYEDDNGEFRPLKRHDGKQPVAIVHSRTKDLLGIFSESYPEHGYKERLFEATQNILDDTLQIGSCGMLRGYRQAWVQVEIPDSIQHSSGEAYRPFITAMSSLDGSLATCYQAGVTRVVCDNTLEAFRGENGEKYKVKNTRNSILKIENAREALDIVFKISEEFERELAWLLSLKVSEPQWEKFKMTYVKVPEDKGRGRTLAESKLFALDDLYHNNPMVAPWSGTAWGVQQAVNTYEEHLSIVRNMQRIERNMSSVLGGHAYERDREVLKVLATVL